MSDEAARLDAVRARLDAMTRGAPARPGLWSRIVTPILRVVGWQARFETKRLFELLDASARGPEEEELLGAIVELEDNVETAERACQVKGYVPTAHASWLYRVEELVRRVASLRKDDGPAARRVLAGLDRTRVLPPLRIAPAKEEATAPETERDPSELGSRLRELELAAIDHIIEAARAETEFLDRRRRLLEGARRLLLDASASLELDGEGVLARQRHLAGEITKLDRLEAAGLAPATALSYQVKQARRRGDRDKLYAALVAVDGFALTLGDASVSRISGAALQELDSGEAVAGDDDRLRSAEQVFGGDVVARIRAEYEAARGRAERGEVDPELTKLALEYLAPGTEQAALSALLSVDGCFEVGASLAPVRIREHEEVARLVSHPTRELLVVPATDIRDLPHAIVTDPRSILLDLATGRLLARKYVERATRPVERSRLIGEARVYVLDGSTSMLEDGQAGARARVRDAILLAELATLMRRLQSGPRNVRLTLHYRFFTKRLGDVKRVATPAEALAAMSDVVGSARKGGTDIEQALVSSMALIRDKKREDPELGRAGIVLVTDGNAPVDPEVVRKAREEAGDVAIAISVIALGEENPVLRELVAHQRARGERAFYHHLNDADLAALCRGEALGPRVHPSAASGTPLGLRTELDALLLELEDLGRADGKRFAADDDEHQGERAREEAATRDRASLERRYARWFPSQAPRPDLPRVTGDDHDAARVVLATVAEVVGELGGDGLRRKADAIEIVERLLPDARLTPARFRQVLETGAHGAELEIVHRAVAGARESFDDRLGRTKQAGAARATLLAGGRR